MDTDRFYLASQTVELSEEKLYIELRNRLCYYGEPNLNDVVLPIEGAEEKAQSLINMPVVAKYRVNSEGEPDLGGHEAYFDPVSGEVKFGTECVGTHVAVEIKDDLVTVNGVQKVLPCLFATARVWKRHKNTVEAIKRLYSEGKLYTSWEISVNSYEFIEGVKTLRDYLFEGNCLLGEGVLPAYGTTSVVLDVASKKESELLVAEALAKDISADDFKEDKMEKERIEVAEEEISEEQSAETQDTPEAAAEEQSEVVETEEAEENPSETSEEAHEEEEQETEEEEKSEEEADESSEESEAGDQEEDYHEKWVKATEEITKLTDALTESASKVAELTEALEQFKEYKTFYDNVQAEKERKEKEEKIEELSAKALKSKMISKEELESDESIKKMISELDEKGIKELIATRYMESLEKETVVAEASKKSPKRNLEEVEENDGKTIFRAYLSN